MKTPKIETRICKYVFTEEEKRQIAQDMANGVAEVQRLDDHTKAVVSQLKAETDAVQGRVNLAAEKLRSGFEMRDIECEVVMAYIDDVVRWVRTDNGEIAHERRMRPEERQMKLPESSIGDIGNAMIDAAESGALESLRPKKGSDCESVTISHGGRSVTLEAK